MNRPVNGGGSTRPRPVQEAATFQFKTPDISLWAGDNDPDTFRIKLWTEDGAGFETVVYDNGMNQPIDGGSIVIRTKK